MSGELKAIQGVVTLLGRLLQLLRRIPAIDDAVEHARNLVLNPVVIRQIRNPSDPDLFAALELYQKRIPEDQRFEPADIIRWLRDDILTRRDAWATRPTDWFLVAKYNRRVSGFVFFHYYPIHRLAFCGYMVVANSPGLPLNAVSASLCAAVSRLLRSRKELADCTGIVLEVEDPRRESSVRRQDESLARIRRFCTLAETQGWTMRALDIDYKQPRLSVVHQLGMEQPLLLMFARTGRRPLAAEVDRAEVEQVLSFVYLDLYPEGFSTDALENAAYREYCSTVRDGVVKALPTPIRSLSCAELVSRARNIRRKPTSRQRGMATNVGDAASVGKAG